MLAAGLGLRQSAWGAGRLGVRSGHRSLLLQQTRWVQTDRTTQKEASTMSITSGENLDLLNRQRLERPNSPHFTIYRPQITWLASIGHRVTGAGLSGLIYLGGVGYLASAGSMGSASMVGFAAGLPYAVKLFFKIPIAFAFWFHSFNGIRHLTWDAALGMDNKSVIQTGWAVVGISVLATIWSLA